MTLYTQVSSNIRKTWILITAFLVVIIGLGWAFSYIFSQPYLLYGAVAFSMFWTLISYWNSDKMILAMSHAKEIVKSDNPELYRLVENLCITAGLPLPKIYIIDDSSPNAFATGRDKGHAVICFTTGLLQKLEKSELEGVVSHELSHIGNRDILLSSLIVVMVGLISILSNWMMRSAFLGRGDRDRDNNNGIMVIIALVFAILAPIAATLMQLAISRKREFMADASGALLTRYPEGLAKALEKISSDSTPLRFANNATSNLFIDDPMKIRNKKDWFSKLWLTHPPVEERIMALRQMSI